MFMGTVYNSIDEKNRMIVPSKMRAGLGQRCVLTKGLVTMGAMSKIEVWSREIWEAPDNESKMETEEFSKALEEYNF